MGKVVAVCTSDRRGIQKKDVTSGHFDVNWGIEGDAHAGSWHRQVSLLSADKIAAFNEKGAGVIPGAFGENLVVEGMDFRALPVGTLLRCGDVLLEMTQIGKDCHSHCESWSHSRNHSCHCSCILPDSLRSRMCHRNRSRSGAVWKERTDPEGKVPGRSCGKDLHLRLWKCCKVQVRSCQSCVPAYLRYGTV